MSQTKAVRPYASRSDLDLARLLARQLEAPDAACSVPRAIRLIGEAVSAALGQPVPPIGTGRAALIAQRWLAVAQAEAHAEAAEQAGDLARIAQAQRDLDHARLYAQITDERRRQDVQSRSRVRRKTAQAHSASIRHATIESVRRLLQAAVLEARHANLEDLDAIQARLLSQFTQDYDRRDALFHGRPVPADQ